MICTQVNRAAERITYLICSGTALSFIGSGLRGDKDGNANEAQFNRIVGITVESNGSLLVLDNGVNKIKRITLEGID